MLFTFTRLLGGLRQSLKSVRKPVRAKGRGAARQHRVAVLEQLKNRTLLTALALTATEAVSPTSAVPGGR